MKLWSKCLSQIPDPDVCHITYHKFLQICTGSVLGVYSCTPASLADFCKKITCLQIVVDTRSPFMFNVHTESHMGQFLQGDSWFEDYESLQIDCPRQTFVLPAP